MAECNYCTYRRIVRKYGDVEVVPETVDGEWDESVSVRLVSSGESVAWFMALTDWCCCDDDWEVA